MLITTIMTTQDDNGNGINHDDDDDDHDDDDYYDSGDGDGDDDADDDDNDDDYYYGDNLQFLRNMDRPLHSIPSFKQRRHFSGLEAGVRRVTCEKQKLLNYIYSAIYFFTDNELMSQQSICS